MNKFSKKKCKKTKLLAPPRTYPFYVVYITGLEAESTSSCPTRQDARNVVRTFKKWLKEMELDESIITISPGENCPVDVILHVVELEEG